MKTPIAITTNIICVLLCLIITELCIASGNNLTKTSLEKNLRGNGMCFTPNKGQVATMEGKLAPDVLYKGSGGGADVYLRKTGISYVFSDMGKVMHEIEE